jgi:F-type H+-transporting ATPase subunit delta
MPAQHHQLAIARVYARSMVRLAEERGETDSLLAELAAMTSLVDERPELGEFLASPLVSTEDRRGVLESLLRGRASDLLVDSLQVMNRKGRLELLAAVAEGFRQEVRELRGETDVYVTTAVPLSAALRDRLSQAAGRFTGRRPRLVERVDPALLGGLVLQVGDDKIDTSVARELERLASLLSQRASAEILSGKSYTVESDAG